MSVKMCIINRRTTTKKITKIYIYWRNNWKNENAALEYLLNTKESRNGRIRQKIWDI